MIRVILVCFLAGLARAQTSDVSASPAPVGRMIDIGGRRLHIVCSGNGRPTVILIHGTGAFSFDWALVQPQVTATRVCSYDRAGHAWSDAIPTAQTYQQMLDDLHVLLQKAEEKGTFVVVGHSGGGGLVRVFTAAYPKDVAGAVLVDTGHPDSLQIINGKLVRVRTLSDLAPPSGVSGKAPVPMAVVVEKSGHDVHLDQPELVVQAIRDVSEAVRRHSRLITASR